MMRRILRYTAVLLGLLALTAAGQERQSARDPKTPKDFDLNTLDGVAVRYSAVAPSGNWLLVVIHASNPLTDKLLASFDRNQVPQLNGRVVVVVVGASEAKLKGLKAAHPEMVDAAWYRDTGHGIGDQFGMRALPAVSGMRGMGSEWRISGPLLGSDRVRSMAGDWMSKEGAMDEARAPRNEKVKPVKE